jgi:parvulin-like peptidyl-prolyl isomerase
LPLVKKRRQRPLPIPPRPRRRPWSREFRLQVLAIAAFGLFLVIIGGIIGYAFFQDYYEEHVQRPHSKALQVGETTFDLDYFARRLKLTVTQYGLQQQSEQASLVISLVADALRREELLRQRAPVDLGVSVTPAEIELEISDRLGLSQSDPEEFASAYEQELKSSDLSDEEYRRMVEAELLTSKVERVFSLSVPETVEQVRLRQILVGTEDEALEVLERLDAGEDFGDLARELSLDEATKEDGGERGWVTQDELDLSYAVKVFELEVGTFSQPIPGPGGYFIFEVEEKEAEREVTDDQRTSLTSSYYSRWLDEQGTLVPSTEYISNDIDKLQWAAERAFEL